MSSKLPATCTEKDLDPGGPNVRFWGRQSPCTKSHTSPSQSQDILDLVYWVRLGRDIEARSCREWLDPDPKEGSASPTQRAHWPNFLQTIGCTEDELKGDEYAIKFPGVSHTVPLQSREHLDNILRVLSKYLGTTPNYWCQAPPPVLLVCTPDQAARCESRNWIDSVWCEAAIFNKASAAAEAKVQASEVASTLASASEAPDPSLLWMEEGDNIKIEISIELENCMMPTGNVTESQSPAAAAAVADEQETKTCSSPDN